MLKTSGNVSFYFTHGWISVDKIPDELHGYFGPPPNFTFLDVDYSIIHDMIRFLPRLETAERSLRSAVDQAGRPQCRNIRAVMDYLIELLDREDITGVIGYSEGARIAASLILEERRRKQAGGYVPRIKCACFMGGWQAMDPSSAKELFADEMDERITIPTCHVVGSNDPFIGGSLALYNICDPDYANLFDHGGGHTLPREKDVVAELAEAIQDIIEESS